MTQPLSTEERLAAMEANLGGWEAWRAEAVRRFTALEEAVSRGAELMAAIQASVTPVLERLAELERMAGQLQAAATSLETEGRFLELRVSDLDTRLQAVARTARPARTVIRGQVDELREQVAALQAQIPPTEPEGGETA